MLKKTSKKVAKKVVKKSKDFPEKQLLEQIKDEDNRLIVICKPEDIKNDVELESKVIAMGRFAYQEHVEFLNKVQALNDKIGMKCRLKTVIIFD